MLILNEKCQLAADLLVWEKEENFQNFTKFLGPFPKHIQIQHSPAAFSLLWVEVWSPTFFRMIACLHSV